MDRTEQAGLGIAAAGHIVLFAALSASLLSTPDRAPPPSMSVSLVDSVALDAAGPPAPEPPAASVAPESGPPEDAAPPPAPAEAAPEPAPPAKQPEAAPPPKPAPAAKPQPPVRPKPAPSAPARAQTPPKPQPATKTPARPAPTKGTGTQVAANTTTRRGAILGDNFLKGIVADRQPATARGQVAPAPAMSQQAAADIGSAIQRQVQPCAERQQLNAPGAERIRVNIRLNLNRNGSLNGRPQVVGHTGVDDGNARYVDRVDDLAIAAFLGCAPLKGLPPELYDVPRGWKVFTLRFKLPD